MSCFTFWGKFAMNCWACTKVLNSSGIGTNWIDFTSERFHGYGDDDDDNSIHSVSNVIISEYICTTGKESLTTPPTRNATFAPSTIPSTLPTPTQPLPQPLHLNHWLAVIPSFSRTRYPSTIPTRFLSSSPKPSHLPATSPSFTPSQLPSFMPSASPSVSFAPSETKAPTNAATNQLKAVKQLNRL